MANVCDFTITVTGPVEDLQQIKDFLKPAIEACEGGYYGEYILNVEGLLPSSAEAHRWLALTGKYRGKDWNLAENVDDLFEFSNIQNATDEQNDESITSQSCVQFGGASKWCPPLDFVAELSKKFPELQFDCSGTTEHEEYECWEGRNGELAELEYVFTNLPDGEIETWRYSGENILHDQHDIDKLNCEVEQKVLEFLRQCRRQDSNAE